MLKKINKNIVRYSIVFVLTGISFSRIEMRNQVHSVLDYIPDTLNTNTDTLKVLGIILPFLLVFMGGIIADKVGRRIVWALAVFSLGGSWIWLQNLARVPPSAVAGSIIVITFLLSVSTAFKGSSLIWLFDHEGNEGIKTAHGLIYLLLSILVISGFIIHFIKIPFIDTDLTDTLTYILIIMAGFLILTFPENYGNRSESLRDIAIGGIHHFATSRVLHVIVAHFMITGFIFPEVLLLFRALETFHVSFDEIDLNTYVGIETLFIFLFAGLFLIFIKTDLENIIIYPRLFIPAFYFILPSISSIEIFFFIEGGITAFSIISTVAILMLITEATTKNRATVLSIIVLLISIPVFFNQTWISFLFGYELKVLCIMNGIITSISLTILLYAVKINRVRKSLLQEDDYQQ